MDFTHMDQEYPVYPVSWDDWERFKREVGPSRTERWGQAFLNRFDHLAEVAALREGPYLWEDDDIHSVKTKLIESKILPS